MGIELETLALSDLISRSKAIDEINVGAEFIRRVLDDMELAGDERSKYEWGLGLLESCIDDMKELSPVAPTLNGYELKQLVLITKIMEEEGISPEDAVRAFNDIGKMVQIIQKEQERAFHEALKGAMDGLKIE